MSISWPKAVFFFALATLFLSIVAAQTHAVGVTRVMPQESRSDAPLSVTLNIDGAVIGKKTVIGEMLPDGASLSTWSVIGASESHDQIDFSQDGQSLVWSFTPTTTTPSISYRITFAQDAAPSGAAQKEFDAVYALSPSLYGHVAGTLTLLPPLTPLPFVPIAQLENVVSESTGSSTGIAILVIYLVMIAALAYLLWRIRAHDPKRLSVEHVNGHISFVDHVQSKAQGKVSSWFSALGRSGERFTTRVEHIAAPHATAPVAQETHHASHMNDQPVLLVPESVMHTTVVASEAIHGHHAVAPAAPIATSEPPAQESSPYQATAHNIDHFDKRYEKVIKRIEEYEKIAKDDPAVYDLLEGLKEELLNISFEYHETARLSADGGL